MTPGWNRNRELANGQETEEELLNDAFADITDNSLERGPKFLIYAFDITLERATELRLIATDREPLRNLQQGPRCDLDAVWSNDHHLVGMESKRGAGLTATQLERESNKLAAFADGQTPLLLVVTEHYARPDTIDTPDIHEDVAVEWKSWHEVADRIRNTPPDFQAQWGPTLTDAQKLFVAVQFRGFDGMNDGAHFLKSVEDLQVTLCTRMKGYEPGRQFPKKVRHKASDLSYKPTTIHWKIFILDDGTDPAVQGEDVYQALLARDYAEELFIGLNLNTQHDRPNDHPLIATLHNNASRLARTIVEEDMTVLEFPLAWFENPELGEADDRGKLHRRHTDREEIKTVLANRIADGTDKWTARRAFVGYPVHDAEDVLATCQERLKRIESVFDYDSEEHWSVAHLQAP